MRGGSPAALAVPFSGIREVVYLAMRTPGVVRLEIGEPDFVTPAHIVDAVRDAIGAGMRYTQSSGRLSLREKLAARVSRKTGVPYTADQITVSAGADQGIAALFAAVLAPGDEVLIPDPAWPNYTMMTVLYGGRPVAYPLRPENGFLPDVAEVEALVSARTAILVLNSPANPTGIVYPPELVRDLVGLAAAHDLIVVSDEVYDELIFEGEPARAAAYDPDRVVMVYAFSKTYAMTGWRVGYVASRPEIAATLMKLQEPLISCVSEVGQVAAEAALDGPQDCVAEMRAAYRERRDHAHRLLTDAGFDVPRPGGAFYLVVPIGAGRDSRSVCLDMVTEAGVAVAPGTGFGSAAPHHVRVSLSNSMENLTEGIGRFVDYIEKLPS